MFTSTEYSPRPNEKKRVLCRSAKKNNGIIQYKLKKKVRGLQAGSCAARCAASQAEPFACIEGLVIVGAIKVAMDARAL